VNTSLIDAANTIAILDFDLKEASIAPATAPGVLDLPVVGVALGIPSGARFSLFFAFYPPVIDLTFLDKLIRVAHDNNAVVEGIRVAPFNSAASVEFELLRRGIEGDSTRCFHDLLLHLLNISLTGLAKALSLSDDLRSIMFTSLVPSLVRIVCISHGALILLKRPGTRHPAATATTHVIILSELAFIV